MPYWVGGKLYRIWRDRIKVKFIKTSVGSDDYLFCDLFRGCCEGNQK